LRWACTAAADPQVATRIVVLVSGSGSNLQALIDSPDLGGGELVCVVSDRGQAKGLDRARDAGVAAVTVERGDYPDRATWEAALTDAVAAARPDLVVLAGFMRILSGAFVERWPTLNVHPSILPAFTGADAVEQALTHGVKLTGCTVHFVVEEVDAGPIVLQDAIPVEPHDTRETLHARIQTLEHRLLPEAVALFCEDRLQVDGRHVSIRP
jgi:phosphoribosylglycinamide formyltransferase 1